MKQVDLCPHPPSVNLGQLARPRAPELIILISAPASPFATVSMFFLSVYFLLPRLHFRQSRLPANLPSPPNPPQPVGSLSSSRRDLTPHPRPPALSIELESSLVPSAFSVCPSPPRWRQPGRRWGVACGAAHLAPATSGNGLGSTTLSRLAESVALLGEVLWTSQRVQRIQIVILKSSVAN